MTVSRLMGWTKLILFNFPPEGMTTSRVIYPVLEKRNVSPSRTGKLKNPWGSVMVPLASLAL